MLRHVSRFLLKRHPPVVVFCYHRVISEATARAQMAHWALYVTPETFERQIRWMLGVGEFFALHKMYETASRPRFMITFDDGWKDNFSEALPILRKYCVPAMIFLSSHNIDTRRLFWWEELGIHAGNSSLSGEEIVQILRCAIERMANDPKTRCRIDYDPSKKGVAYFLDRTIEYLKTIPHDSRERILSGLYEELNASPVRTGEDLLLTWDEIRSMANEGIAFGSHTHTHTRLDLADPEAIDYELGTSKEVLEDRLGLKVDCFSYPNGNFQNPYIQRSLINHGYRYGFALEGFPVKNRDPFKITRCLMCEDLSRDMDTFTLKILLRTAFRKGP